MLARFVLGAVAAGVVVVPALAGQMNAEEARKFVAAGAVQFSGSGPIRRLRLPGNTLQIRGQAVCASLKGIPFEPCFNLDKKDEASFRGSVSGMGFAYCDFHHQGAAQMLMARSVARPRALHPPEHTGSVEVSARVETPQVEAARIEPVKSETRPEPAKSEAAPELRRSTD
jgi:hypothetical protein